MIVGLRLLTCGIALTASRLLETPTETHAAALRAFGWDVGGGGVLQPRER